MESLKSCTQNNIQEKGLHIACMYIYIIHYMTLHCIALHHIILHGIALHCILFHYTTFIAWHGIAWHCMALHYITSYIHIYIYICMYICIYIYTDMDLNPCCFLPLGFLNSCNIIGHAVDGCKILHHQKDGWNPVNHSINQFFQLVQDFRNHPPFDIAFGGWAADSPCGTCQGDGWATDALYLWSPAFDFQWRYFVNIYSVHNAASCKNTFKTGKKILW